MDRHLDAARLLLSARRDPSQRLHSLPEALRPKTAVQAYAVQRAVMAELGPVGGWKVGSPRPDGDVFTCAPLPLSGITDSPGMSDAPLRGVEAELAVRLSRDLPAREETYSEAEVMAAVASLHPAIEVLDTRYMDADAQDPFSALADSLSHGGLVLGAAVPGWEGLDLHAEQVRLLLDGADVKAGAGNPGGAIPRLLAWLANEGARWAGGLRAGQVVTTGSWTGKDYAAPGGEARAVFARCGDASVRFS